MTLNTPHIDWFGLSPVLALIGTSFFALLCAVLVPRGQPVREQLLRARLLAARGLFDMVEPDALVPDVLLATVRAALARPVPAAVIDLEGLSRVRARVTALLADRPR